MVEGGLVYMDAVVGGRMEVKRSGYANSVSIWLSEFENFVNKMWTKHKNHPIPCGIGWPVFI